MSVAVVFSVCLALFLIAFMTYGRILARRFELSKDRRTPAHEVNDGEDFVPTKKGYLLAQHFSAISAAGPIVGPIRAAVAFGWLPAMLWVVFGCIFIGAMHDFSALAGSVRHNACSIAEIVGRHMSKRARLLFLSFVWLALVYVIVAFTDITTGSFLPRSDVALDNGFVVRGAGIATSSIAYLGVGVLMGLALRFMKMPLWLATVIFVPLVGVVIWYGQSLPIALPETIALPIFGSIKAGLFWDYMVLVYCGVASILPVWFLLQPRGYLGGFFLYGMMGAAFAGILFGGIDIKYPAWIGFSSASAGPLFPALFVTIACGACSGFHGLVCSGTTSKQLDRETDAHLVGYGGMLLEGVVACISLVCVMVLARGDSGATGDPNLIFARGIGRFMQIIGINPGFAVAFGLLAFGTFVFDTLDVATRLGRYILQELVGAKSKFSAIVATIVTLVVPGYFMSAELKNAKGVVVPAWQVFWNVFGTSNQLLAGLTLLGLAMWLKNSGKKFAAWVVGLPMVLMMIVTLVSIFQMLKTTLFVGRYADPIGWVALVLGGLAVLLMIEAAARLKSTPAAHAHPE